MATWTPISGAAIQFQKNAGGAASSDFFIKFFAAGTTTPINMATDSTGGTLLAKARLNSSGYVRTEASETSIFLPHINQTYKLSLFPTEADADANTNAVWTLDNVELGGTELTTFIADLADNTDVAKGSSLVGHILNAIGAATAFAWNLKDAVNHLFDRTLDFSDPRFGGVGDGTTDNYDAMVAIISTGRSFFVPDGVFLIDLAPFGANRRTGFELESGVTVRGPGEILTKFENAAEVHDTPDLFYLKDKKNIKIIGVNFNNITDHDIVGSSIKGVQNFIGMESTVDHGVDDILIQGCSFNNSFSTGVNVWEKLNDSVNSFISRDVRVLGNSFRNTGAHAIAIVKGELCDVSHNTGYNIGNIIFQSGAAPGHMVDMSNGCFDSTVDNNRVTFCRAGYKSQDFSTIALGEGATHDVSFTNNKARNIKDIANGYIMQLSGYNIHASGNGLISGVDEISGLPSTQSGGIKGIFIQDNAKDCSAEDNDIDNHGADGISIGGNSNTANMKRGNKAHNNRIKSTATGIRVSNDLSAKLTDNTVEADGVGIAWESTYVYAHNNAVTAPTNCFKVSSLGDNTGLVDVSIVDNEVNDGNIDLGFDIGKMAVDENEFALTVALSCIAIGANADTLWPRSISNNNAILDSQVGSQDVFLLTDEANVLRGAAIIGNAVINNRTDINSNIIKADLLECTLIGNTGRTTNSRSAFDFKTASDFNAIGPNVVNTNGTALISGTPGASSTNTDNIAAT